MSAAVRGSFAGMSLRGQLMHGGFASIALKMASLAGNLVITATLARLLAPAGYGVYAMALAIMSLMAVPIQLGLPTLILREATLYLGASQWGLLRGLLRWSYALVFGMAVAVGALTILVSWAWRQRLGDSLFFTLGAAVPLLAIGSLTSVRQSVLMGLKRVILAQVPELLCLPVLYLGFLLGHHLVVAAPLEPQGAMVGYVACYGLAFVIGAIALARRLPGQVRSAIPETRKRLWLASILPLSLISGFSLMSSQLVIPILGFFSNEESVGLYRVAMSGAALTTVVGATIGGFVAPYIATFYSQRDFGRLQRLATWSAWACLVPALVALTLFSTVGDDLLRMVFGERFVAASGALVVLTIGQTINCGTGIVHSLLTMTGHEREALRGSVLGAVTNVVFAFALIPKFGLMGAAAATCLAVALENLLLYGLVQSRLHVGSSIFSVG